MEGDGYESIRTCHGLSVTEKKKKKKHQVIPTINMSPGVHEELTLGKAAFTCLTPDPCLSNMAKSFLIPKNLELETQVSL